MGSEAIGTTTDVDDTIERVEKLYRTLTGSKPPAAESAYAPIPAEEDPSRHVEEQMDRLLSLLGEAGPGAPAVPWIPPLSAWESETEVLVCLDVPGVAREAVEVKLQGNLLTVAGRRTWPAAEGEKLRINERLLGAFRRTLWIPAAARAAEPDARLRDGVLEIRVPKETPGESAKTVFVN